MMTTKTCTVLFILGLSLSVGTGCGNNDAGNTLEPVTDASTDLSVDLSDDAPQDLLSALCERDERVVSNQCQACAAGATNAPGDDPSGANTQCDTTSSCAQDERVAGNQCQPCAAGTTNESGDDSTGPDTQCDAFMCQADERVLNNQCDVCPKGSTNESGDDPTGAETSCDPILCEVNERVADNQCDMCAVGETNAAGDDATGANTSCDDPCSAVLGVACADVEQAYLKASNTGTLDEFGQSVAFSGDTLVVSASTEDSGATGVNGDQFNADALNSGAVYVFTRTNGVWSQQAYLKASNAGVNDGFGRSIALSGDTIVVGAGSESSDATKINGDQTNNNAQSSGAAYVFTRTNGVWSQQAYLKASNSETFDGFGSFVALEADTLVVSALGEDSDAVGVNGDQNNNNARVSGAVYVFTRTNGRWSQQAYLKASNTKTFHYFGGFMVLSGDTLAVAAADEASDATGINGDQSNGNARSSGAVYVFARSNGMWGQQAYIKASNTGVGDRFGAAMALSADTLAVGAATEGSDSTGINGGQSNDNAPDSGAVYVFTRTNRAWSQQAYLKASNAGAGDYFGRSVALDADTLVVGASSESSDATGLNGDQANDNAQDSGAVYTFTRANGVWSQQAYLKSSAGLEGEFGGSVALSGDTLIVGARGENSDATGIDGDQTNQNAPSSGAAYVYKIAP